MQEDFGLHFWLTQWNLSPSIFIGTALVLGLYFYGIGPARRKYQLAESVKRGQVVAFVIGVLVIFFALTSPLDALGDDYLFSAHMIQHMLITIVGPPLMLVGLPGWLVQPLLRNHAILQLAKWVTYPVVAFLLFNVDIWLWHAPPLYDATLVNDNIHILEHISFIVFALINWWPVFSPVEELPRLSIGGQVLYIFVSGMPMVLLGAGLTFTPPLYAPYIHQTIRAWGLSPTSDQQLGGLIMWVPGGLLYIVIMSILFIHWMQRQDAKQRAQEAVFYGDEDEVADQIS